MRAIIEQWADGTYRGQGTIDDDGRGNDDIMVRATVTVRGSNLDGGPAGVGSASEELPQLLLRKHAFSVAMALFFLVDPEIPKNDGAMRPVEILVKPGTIVFSNPGAPVTMSTSHCAQEIIEAIVVALSQACPERTMGGLGSRLRIAIKGTDPENGRPFIWHMFHARPAPGPHRGGDGWHNLRGMALRRRTQVRLGGGGRGAFPAVLRAPRVQSQLRR